MMTNNSHHQSHFINHQHTNESIQTLSSFTKTKIIATRNALRVGLNVLVSDPDVFWCVDARPVLTAILQSTDYLDADVVIQAQVGYRSLNSGFYFVRANARSIALFDALLQQIEHVNHLKHDHDILNAVFCNVKYGGRMIRQRYGMHNRIPFSCLSHGATIRLLDVEQFPSGAQPVRPRSLYPRVRTHRRRAQGQKQGRQQRHVPVFSLPRQELLSRCRSGEFVVLHNNFIHADKKIARFLVKGMWFLNPLGSQCSHQALPSTSAAVRTCGLFC